MWWVIVVEQGGDYEADSDRELNGRHESRHRMSDDDNFGGVNRRRVDEDDDDEYDSEEDEDYDDRPKKKKKRSAVSKFIVEEAGRHVVFMSCYNKDYAVRQIHILCSYFLNFFTRIELRFEPEPLI